MSSNEYKDIADQLQSQLAPLMSEHGFKKRGRSFYRLTADGLTQIVHLQMGPFDPPGTTYIPGLRENLYGSLTVDLGVYIPEVSQYHGGSPKKTVQEYNCSIRARLGELSDKRDIWWELRSGSGAYAEISRRLLTYGLPWLDGLATRDAILQALEGLRDPPWGATSPPRIISAIIQARRGRSGKARELLRAQALETSNPGHPEYVRALAAKLELGALDA